MNDIVYLGLTFGQAIATVLIYVGFKRKTNDLEGSIKYLSQRIDTKSEMFWELRREYNKLVDALGYELTYPGPIKYVKKGDTNVKC